MDCGVGVLLIIAFLTVLVFLVIRDENAKRKREASILELQNTIDSLEKGIGERKKSKGFSEPDAFPSPESDIVENTAQPAFMGIPVDDPLPQEKVSPPKPRPYSEKASSFEMELAGNWLNLAGIILVTVGFIFCLRQALESTQSMHRGLLEVLLGGALGAFLILQGDRLHWKKMGNLGQSLVGGGFCILFLTVSAAYFYYHLIGSALILSLLIFAIVTASGITMFRYDSKIIAGITLFISFMTPFILSFKLGDQDMLYFYLIAINLGVLFLASHKKWDFYIAASFLMTYIHYFLNYSLTKGNSISMFNFLTVFYLIFLFANNLSHFRRKTPENYDLFISYFNPLLYGCLSYVALHQKPNWLALATYAALGIIHVYMSVRSFKMENIDELFKKITDNNLVIGLLFITAAISFVAHFTDNDKYFALVTALWFAEAFALGWVGFTKKFRPRIFRRFSYLTLGMIWVQLICVVSWMPDSSAWQMINKFSIYFVSMALFYCYFRMMYKARDSFAGEDDSILAASLLSVFGIVVYLTHNRYGFYVQMLLAAVLASVNLYSSLKLRDRLFYFRYFSYAAFAAISFLTIAYAFMNPVQAAGAWAQSVVMILIYIFVFVTLKKYREHLPANEKYIFAVLAITPVLLMLVVSGGLALDSGSLNPLIFLAAAAVAIRALFHLARSFPEELSGLKLLAHFSQAIVTLAVLTWPFTIWQPNQAPVQAFLNYRFLACLLIAFFFLGDLNLIKRNEDVLADTKGQYSFYILTLVSLILMKSFLVESPGMVSTLAWAVVGLLVLSAGFKSKDKLLQGLAHVILFLGVLKSLLFDASAISVLSSDYIDLTLNIHATKLFLSLGWICRDIILIIFTGFTYYLASRLWRENPRLRDIFQAYALIIFSFQLSALLFKVYGCLDNFQIILTEFWCSVSLLYIITGLLVSRKIFRLFGLVLLLASLCKILLVDIWVLQFYNMATLFFIMGGILIVTSFVYQKNREKLIDAAAMDELEKSRSRIWEKNGIINKIVTLE